MSGAEDDAASGIVSFKSGSIECAVTPQPCGQLDTYINTGCIEELVFQGFSFCPTPRFLLTLSGSFLDFPKV